MSTDRTTRDPRPPHYSVVVPAYNASRTLSACLTHLGTQSVPRVDYEVIVINDGSTDDTPHIARGYGARVHSQTRQGPAAARNVGLRMSQADVVLFTDADCMPTVTWIEEMVAPFADPEVVGVRGTYLTRQTELVARFVQLEYEDRYDRIGPGDRIDFIDTYSAGYRRDVLLANGGFDSSFRTPSVEDQELSFRLARRGCRLVFAPQATVYHQHDRSCSEYAVRKFNIGYWKAWLSHRYPERMVADTHTPQVLKLQMVLMGCMASLCLAAFFWDRAIQSAAACLGLFMLTSLPFLLRVARKDPAVSPVCLPLLVVRAVALGAGFTLGQMRYVVTGGDHR